MVARLTQHEVEERLAAHGFVLKGKYVNGTTPTEVICPQCKRPFLTTPASIVKNNVMSCRRCGRKAAASRRRLTQAEAEERFAAKGFTLLGPYKGSKELTKVKCPLCGEPFDVKPNSVFTGATRSCGCLQPRRASEVRRLPLEEVQKRFIAKGFPAPLDYQRNDKPVTTICPYCQKPFSVLPMCIFSGHTQSCGCYKLEETGKRSRRDISGLHHGLLTAIRPTNERRRKKVVWEFQCDCGNPIYLTINELQNYASCGCQHYKSGEDHHGWKGAGELSGGFWAGFQVSARRRKKKIEISIDDAWNLLLEQNRRCAMSGVRIRLAPYSGGTPTASLDRIDSKKGYLPGNVHWVHKTVNRIKGKLPLDQFQSLCGLVAHPLRSTEPSAACLVQKKHGLFRGYGNIPQTYWHSVVQGTGAGKHITRSRNSFRRRHGITLQVTGHEAWQVFLRQNGKCALTGLDLDFGSGGTDRRNYHLGSASLDRIDSAKGYSLDNIQWVHKQVNLMKSDLDQSEFIRWCKRVARHSVAATVSLAGSLQPTAPAD